MPFVILDILDIAGGLAQSGTILVIGAAIAFLAKKYAIKVCDSFSLEQSNLIGQVVFWLALLNVAAAALARAPEFTSPAFVSLPSIGTGISSALGVGMSFILPVAILIAALAWKRK